MPKAALYCRLSVEDGTGEESESIKNQRMLLRDYAERRGWDIFDIYEDEDYSGLRDDRPDFCRMLKDAQEGRFQIILCKTQSRFSRNALTAEKYLHEMFPLWGIRFVTVVDGADTAVRGNKKARQINSLINEWYSEELSENIRMVLRRKMEEGQYLGNYAPYGYKRDPSDRHRLIIRQEEADVVRLIAGMYLSGLSCAGIAQRLNIMKIPTPTQAKQARGEDKGRKNAGLWRGGTVAKILKNPVYLGHMAQGREEKISFKKKKTRYKPQGEWITVKNTHEKILSEEEFEAIGEIMKRNTRRGAK